tara:strand:+ start:35 stop:433 length:399 start_codon:yes stop_codon:yes gene_type:complete
MKEVYLYFRTAGAIGDDDAAGDSACYPLSHFCGAIPSADDTLNLYFKPAVAVQANDPDDDAANIINNDKIVISLSANNTHKDVIARLMRLFSGAANGGIHHDGFIDVVDDVAGTTAVTGIAGLSTMTAPTLS